MAHMKDQLATLSFLPLRQGQLAQASDEHLAQLACDEEQTARTLGFDLDRDDLLAGLKYLREEELELQEKVSTAAQSGRCFSGWGSW